MVSISPPPPPAPNTIYWLLVAFCLPVLALLVEVFKALLGFAAKVVDKPAVKPPDNVQPIRGGPKVQNGVDIIGGKCVNHDSRITENNGAIKGNTKEILEIWKAIANK